MASLVHSRFKRLWRHVEALCSGYFTWRDRIQWTPPAKKDDQIAPNRMQAFFEKHHSGHGIWKWAHYFEIYDRHLQGFCGQDVVIVEIGIYSGGSLEMWRDYFGENCRVVGVDIEPACKVYESKGVRVFIGDQSDREFWNRFKLEVGPVDIVIDDGGHEPQQQIVTLEEMLPHLRPGGVYICEDIHGAFNGFTSYVQGIEQHLSACSVVGDPDHNERRLVSRASPLQDSIGAIHVYPFITVIERTRAPIGEFIAPKMGTQWQPFLEAMQRDMKHLSVPKRSAL